LTAGQWSWKSISAKKCVTTYLPNELALKIDDAKALNLNSTDKEEYIIFLSCRWTWYKLKSFFEVILNEIYIIADLGSSSKYSSENLEDRSRDRFHENWI